MRRETFRLPDIGEGIAEAEIVAWHVAVDDRIEEDQALVDVMTDKATVELASPIAGIVVAIHGDVGQRVAVGAPLVEFEINQEEKASDSTVRESAGRSEPSKVSASADNAFAATTQEFSPRQGIFAPEPRPVPTLASVMRAPRDAPLASPATRRRADELGVALRSVPGTGPAGRITAGDLDAYVAHSSGGDERARQFRAKRTGIADTKIVGLRRKIADKMQQAKRHIPHFTYVEEFDVTELESLRGELNAGRSVEQPKLTLLPFFMRALVKLIPDFPQMNAHYDDEAGILRSYEGVHVGIATQIPGGLLAPVVRHVEARDLWDCARELIRVTSAAREGNATRDELTGSTITLTSLGALGGISATPIINHPEVAIIGPNKAVNRPMALDGQIAIRTMMNLSSSFDHRIVDGYDAARFIQGLKHLIERPALLFLDHE
ncbi:MAG: dihydrolipoamide acetyltransferase family protein [Roseiarcus sp.]|jgi:2-oxoisovalerate dehydrogenase E2 component (dihydrolipoyl transacylase)